jgi:hypothetical protein
MAKNDVAVLSDKSYVMPRTQNTNNETKNTNDPPPTLKGIGVVSFGFLMYTLLVVAVASTLMEFFPGMIEECYNLAGIFLTAGITGTLAYFIQKYRWQAEQLPNETPRKFLSSTVSRGIRIKR